MAPSTAVSSTMQPSKWIRAKGQLWRPLFASIGPTTSPGVSMGTTKAVIPHRPRAGSVVANTMTTSATGASVTHAFTPSSCSRPSSSGRAVVVMAATSDPASGSDMANDPIASPLHRSGSQPALLRRRARFDQRRLHGEDLRGEREHETGICRPESETFEGQQRLDRRNVGTAELDRRPQPQHAELGGAFPAVAVEPVRACAGALSRPVRGRGLRGCARSSIASIVRAASNVLIPGTSPTSVDRGSSVAVRRSR